MLLYGLNTKYHHALELSKVLRLTSEKTIFNDRIFSLYSQEHLLFYELLKDFADDRKLL